MAYLKSPTTIGGENIYDLAFVSGTHMIFMQASAPSGWTRRTDINDVALRVVNGNSGVQINAGIRNFSSVFNSAIGVSGTVGSTSSTGSVGTSGGTAPDAGVSITVAGHAISVSEMPLHSHTAWDNGHTHVYYDAYSNQSCDNDGGGGCQTSWSTAAWRTSNAGYASIGVGNQGGSATHSHSASGVVSVSNHTHSGGALTMDAHNHSFTGTALNMSIKYCDVIVAEKD